MTRIRRFKIDGQVVERDLDGKETEPVIEVSLPPVDDVTVDEDDE